MTDKRIYVCLNGGLGNQMFQYATARALALRVEADLILDTWSGFVRDYQYSRHFELDYLPIQAKIASPLERLPIWLFRAENKLRGSRSNLIQKKIYGNFLVENKLHFIKSIKSFEKIKNLWMLGYWQSPHYFQEYIGMICSELMPPNPEQKKYIDLAHTMIGVDSVALGIRLYEESIDPPAHAKDGLMKTALDVQKAISMTVAKHPNAIFFVFCTHRAKFLSKLNLPSSTIYVTHDDGYTGSAERLWLLAQCKHHIFTNSSYYWWGAQLSKYTYLASDRPQSIFAADNFTNEDALYPEWETF
jgi:hypothetical protein